MTLAPARLLARLGPTRLPTSAPLGLALLGGYLLLALLAPVVAPYDPHDYSFRPLQPPSPPHPLGTNDAGHDILSELVHGARVSVVAGVSVAILAGGGGALVGAVSGYLGGWADLVAMRVVDAFLVLPRLPLLLLLAAYLDDTLAHVVIILAFVSWPEPARVVRGQVASLRQRGHIQAAQGFGAGSPHVLVHHLLPELGPILVALLVRLASRAILMEAGLAFLGIGDITAKSWGLMINHALRYPGIYFGSTWVWWLLPPALCVAFFVLGLTLVGASLEHRLNPRLGRAS
jgi:peptide/nickel transport system permease protein